MNGWGPAGSVAATLVAVGLLCGLAPAAAPALAAGSPASTITTVAGGPGRGVATRLMQDTDAVATGPGGEVYVADSAAVREFGITNSWEGIAAGIGIAGYSGNGGPAVKAQLNEPGGLAVGAAGNLVISDTYNSRVRVVAARTGTFYGRAMTAGYIYTVAGDGTSGFSGDGGPGTAAELREQQGVAVDAAGNLVIADGDNNRVRVVAARTGTFYGRAMTAGYIYTVAGDGTPGFSGDGGPATAATLTGPEDVAVDAAGNLVIADTVNWRVRVVAARTGTFYGQAMTAGDIYTVAGDGTRGFSGDGGPATSAELTDALSVAVDTAGNLVIADTGNDRVRVVAARTGTFYGQAMTAGDIYTVAGDGTSGFSGDGGPATSAELYDPQSVAVDAAGNLVIADTANWRVRVVAARSGTFYGQAMTAGDIYTVAGIGDLGFSGNKGLAVDAEPGDYAGGQLTDVAVDGRNYVATASNHAWFICQTSGTYFGQAMTAGHIYTVAGTGRQGYSGDGGPATAAELFSPSAVAVDAAGNLVVADSENNRVRVVAARTGTFYGRAMTAGDIYTVAGNGKQGYSGDGGRATAAGLDRPRGLAVDAAGNLVIADSSNYRVRVVAARTGTFYGRAMTAGDIYTVAGNGLQGFSGDGGLATAAGLDRPWGVAVDAAGNLVIADSGNNRVRVVAATSGTFYGQAMTAGDIYTVAGDGMSGFPGDGGPATSARLYGPEGVAVNGSGNLVIADTRSARVRLVSG